MDKREGRSRPVAILGASVLGGALAHKLAGRDRVDEIRVVDPNATVAAGTALDIQQAGSIEGFRTRVVSAGDVQAAAGAAVIVLAGLARPTALSEDEDENDQGEAEYAILKQVAQLDSDAVLVCADASHRPLIERGVREMKIPRARVIGSAPGALASALRALVALEVEGSPSQVALAVLGTPPHHTVISWSDATVRGQAPDSAVGTPEIDPTEGPRALPVAAWAVLLGVGRLPRLRGDRRRRIRPCLFLLRRARPRAGRPPRRISPVGRARSAGRHPYSDPVVERARARRARERAGREITGGASGASELGRVTEDQAVREFSEPLSKNESTAMET